VPLTESVLDPGARRRFGVVLLSGGLDSTTVAAVARGQGYELLAVTVNYGQAHRREVLAAEAVAQELGIAQRIVDVSFFRDLAWYSALTQPERFGLPGDRSTGQMATDVPITYVPLRNTFSLTLGAAVLESQALHAIEKARCRRRSTRRCSSRPMRWITVGTRTAGRSFTRRLWRRCGWGAS
jgi:7-cyano-7-deazaguanine synthase in queuosine biosynthesis